MCSCMTGLNNQSLIIHKCMPIDAPDFGACEKTCYQIDRQMQLVGVRVIVLG